MIKDCIARQRDGLKAPKAVTDVTANYLAAEDQLPVYRLACMV
jgi:hypothetical protein